MKPDAEKRPKKVVVEQDMVPEEKAETRTKAGASS
jgi:hypothetical protein